MNKKVLFAGAIVGIITGALNIIKNIIVLVTIKDIYLPNIIVYLLGTIFSIAAIVFGVLIVKNKDKDENTLVKYLLGFVAASNALVAIEQFVIHVIDRVIIYGFVILAFVCAILAVVGLFVRDKNTQGSLLNVSLSSLMILPTFFLTLCLILGVKSSIAMILFISTRVMIIVTVIILYAGVSKYLKALREAKKESSSLSGESSDKVNKIKEYQEKYGMTLLEAKELVDAEEEDAKAKQAKALVQDSNQGANVQNQGNMSGITIAPVSSDNPLPQTAGLGLDKSAFAQPQKTVSSEDAADLKRQLLQGKITRAEFDEKMAELKK